MRETLAASVGNVYFSDLRAHLARGVVIVLAPSLDIVDVGEALARDDKARVQAWIEAGALRKPSLVELELWAKIADDRWESLVVAPFVLVRQREAPADRPS